ncbi:MAG: hypothetical protein HYX69_01165 [Planctomycetia bacterium]|nr:hypothetical protein [Planctomycetia bacterium]
MRILFTGGLYRGWRLAQRLVERGEEVVGAFVFEEDAHETPKFCDELVSLFSARNVWCQKTRKITDRQAFDVIRRLAPDVILCMGWRTLIPMSVLDAVPRGGIAVHDSLLPRLRGFAPTNWGLILGHDRLGATLFRLSDEVDAGEIYFQEAIVPESRESYSSVQEKIAEVAVRLFDRYLDACRAGTLVAQPKRDEKATYACARAPADGEIDWRSSSAAIDRLIRALGPPAPGAFTFVRGAPLYILDAHPAPHPRNYEGRIPGRIVDRDAARGSVDVLCGEGMLRVEKVRLADGRESSAASVLRSVREWLGLNHSAEIIELRARLERLEARLVGSDVVDAVTRTECG